MRFENEENEKDFVEGLAKEVAERLQKYDVKGKSITVKVYSVIKDEILLLNVLTLNRF